MAQQRHVIGPPSLETLPVEIFKCIVEHLNTATELTNVSRTCKKLNELVRDYAWMPFVLSRFPTLAYAIKKAARVGQRNDNESIRNQPDTERAAIVPRASQINNEWKSVNWEHLAKSLTGQSRAWDRRAFSFSLIDPIRDARLDIQDPLLSADQSFTKYDSETQKHSSFSLNRPHRQHKPGIQTTGYHPVIDATLEFSNSLHNKKEIVAWSTGAQVFVRVRRSGSMCPSAKEYNDQDELINDAYNNITSVASISHPEYLDGLDDVATLNIVPPTLGIRGGSEGLVIDVIIGRSSGLLNRFSVNVCRDSNCPNPKHGFFDEYRKVVVSTFVPGSKQGRNSRHKITSTDVVEDTTPVLACTSDTFLSLYKTESLNHDIEPLDEIQVETESRNETTSLKFLSREKLIVGLKNHCQPLRSFQVTPYGIVQKGKLSYGAPGHFEKRTGSICALEPVPSTSRSGGSLNGYVFLSGWHHGSIRLYDLRASYHPVAKYDENLTDPVYSLTTYGQERFVCGDGRSQIRVFDFRLGAKVYSYTDALPCSSKTFDELEQDSLWSFCHPSLRTRTIRSSGMGNEVTLRPILPGQITTATNVGSFPSHLHNSRNLRDCEPSSSLDNRLRNSTDRIRNYLQSPVTTNRILQSPWPPRDTPSYTQSQPGTCAECRYDFRRQTARRCEFHKNASYKLDSNLYLYSKPRNENTHHRTRNNSHETSPIFSLVSASPISPTLYIGTLGSIYELSVEEIDENGLNSDPYFNSSPFSVQSNALSPVVMYEVDSSNSIGLYRQTLSSGLMDEQNSYFSGAEIDLRTTCAKLDRRWGFS